jgi:hypothetical protein
MKRFINFFDHVEDRVRSSLSKYPILYGIIGGITVVVFWRSVWVTTDEIVSFFPERLHFLNGPVTFLLSTAILLATGLFVSFFVTDRVLLSGIKHEEKNVLKVEKEMKQERQILTVLSQKIDKIEHTVEDIRDQQKSR